MDPQTSERYIRDWSAFDQYQRDIRDWSASVGQWQCPRCGMEMHGAERAGHECPTERGGRE